MAVVSIIIPNYNHAPFLKERIESLLQQTYKDFEIIILDDCSADNSRDIIESYRFHHSISKISYNETNSGSTFKQWQKGIALSAGKYIWIAESDDWCEPTLLEELVNGMEQNENVAIGYCGAVVVNENEILYTSASNKFKEVLNGIAFIKSHMIESNLIFNASMAIFKKDCFNKISSEYTSYKFCGDWLFWIMLAQKGDVYISGKYLNYFRKHSADVSNKSMADGTYFEEYTRLAEYLLRSNLIDRPQYHVLLFKRYQKLKVFEGDEVLKKKLLLRYATLIGKKNRFRIKAEVMFHNAYITAWLVTPFFIKKIIRNFILKKTT